MPHPQTNDTNNAPNTSSLDMPDMDIFDMEEEAPDEELDGVEDPPYVMEIEGAPETSRW